MTLAACRDARQEVQLAGGVDVLGGSAVAFPSAELLRASSASPGAGLCLMPKAPFRRARDSVALRAPGGTLVRPFALALQPNGNVDTLRTLFAQGIDELCIGVDAGATSHAPWSSVQVVSAAPLMLDRVAWQSRRP